LDCGSAYSRDGANLRFSTLREESSSKTTAGENCDRTISGVTLVFRAGARRYETVGALLDPNPGADYCAHQCAKSGAEPDTKFFAHARARLPGKMATTPKPSCCVPC